MLKMFQISAFYHGPFIPKKLKNAKNYLALLLYFYKILKQIIKCQIRTSDT